MKTESKRMKGDTFFDRLIKESFRALPIGERRWEGDISDFVVDDMEAEITETNNQSFSTNDSIELSQAKTAEDQRWLDDNRQGPVQQQESLTSTEETKKNSNKDQPTPKNKPYSEQLADSTAQAEKSEAPLYAQPESSLLSNTVLNKSESLTPNQHVELQSPLNRSNSTLESQQDYLDRSGHQITKQAESTFQNQTLDSNETDHEFSPSFHQKDKSDLNHIQTAEPITQDQAGVSLTDAKPNSNHTLATAETSRVPLETQTELGISAEQSHPHKYSFGQPTAAKSPSDNQAQLRIGTVNIKVLDNSQGNSNGQGAQQTGHKRGSTTQRDNDRTSKSQSESRSFLRTL